MHHRRDADRAERLAAARRSAARRRRRGRRRRPAGPTRRRRASRSRLAPTNSVLPVVAADREHRGRSSPIRHALMRVEPNSMPSDVRPARIASRTLGVCSRRGAVSGCGRLRCRFRGCSAAGSSIGLVSDMLPVTSRLSTSVTSRRSSNGGRRRRRRAHDEDRRRIGDSGCRVPEHLGDAPPRLPREVEPHRGERRAVERGIRVVVEARDADLAGHVDAGRAETGDQPERHLVVRDDDGGRAAGRAHRRGDDRRDRGARARAPVADPARTRLESPDRASTAIDAASRASASSQSSGPASRAMRRCPRSARCSTASAARIRLPLGARRRRAASRAAPPARASRAIERAGMRCHHDDPVDPLAEQVTRGAFDGGLVRGIRVRRRDPPADLARGGLEGADAGRRTVERGVGRDDTERARRPGAERPRGVVDPVVERRHGLEHPRARLGADVGVLVDHPGDRLRRHTGEAGDIAHADAACRVSPSLMAPQARPASGGRTARRGRDRGGIAPTAECDRSQFGCRSNRPVEVARSCRVPGGRYRNVTAHTLAKIGNVKANISLTDDHERSAITTPASMPDQDEEVLGMQEEAFSPASPSWSAFALAVTGCAAAQAAAAAATAATTTGSSASASPRPARRAAGARPTPSR